MPRVSIFEYHVEDLIRAFALGASSETLAQAYGGRTKPALLTFLRKQPAWRKVNANRPWVWGGPRLVRLRKEGPSAYPHLSEDQLLLGKAMAGLEAPDPERGQALLLRVAPLDGDRVSEAAKALGLPFPLAMGWLLSQRRPVVGIRPPRREWVTLEPVRGRPPQEWMEDEDFEALLGRVRRIAGAALAEALQAERERMRRLRARAF